MNGIRICLHAFGHASQTLANMVFCGRQAVVHDIGNLLELQATKESQAKCMGLLIGEICKPGFQQPRLFVVDCKLYRAQFTINVLIGDAIEFIHSALLPAIRG
jgi:hypothetical protein